MPLSGLRVRQQYVSLRDFTVFGTRFGFGFFVCLFLAWLVSSGVSACFPHLSRPGTWALPKIITIITIKDISKAPIPLLKSQKKHIIAHYIMYIVGDKDCY